MYKRLLPVLLVCVALIVMLTVAGTLGAAAENTVTWVDVAENAIPNKGQPSIVPQKFRLVATDLGALSSVLATAPLERSADAAQRQVIVALPLPNGGVGRFSIVASPIMAPELAATFPAITTYSGQGLDDPTATVRLDRTPTGFHALILSNGDPIFIDPYSPQNLQHYISYFRRDYRASEDDLFDRLNEQVIENTSPRPETQNPQRPSGAILRTYRLAMAATGEYTAFHGGTVAGGQAAIVTSVNRVNAVYEREVAVRMILVANNNLLVYTNGNTDPYTNDNGFAMLDENQTTIDAVIGSANYDIGHVFSTGGGGVAQLGVVCNNSAKAEGVTGRSQPIGDPFDIDYVAHEIGHQFDALHTFNSTTNNCGGGNRSPSAAYEPGSGSTVMAYAGICGADDLQPNSDAYFHSKSYEEITNFITLGGGNSCAAQSATGNTPPTVDAGATYIIPAQTPFTLTGIGNDADGDAITYNWEEYDLGAASPPNTDNGNRPIFRSFNASSSPSRTFPKLSDILTNTSTFGELLPTTNRTLNFRLTVRDNRAGGGGVAVDTTALTVTNTAGPFRVFVPNSAVTWSGGSNYAVQWDKANTDLAPINCATVNILFSSDGGLTFPTTLATSQQNDGIHVITIPNINTSLGRIKVGCATNIFFDISNANLTINPIIFTNTVYLPLMLR